MAKSVSLLTHGCLWWKRLLLLLAMMIEYYINMADKEMIEEKIGEALGLEKAAQKAVEELDSRGLLKPEHMKKLSKMKEEASRQEQQMEELVQQLTESDGLDSEKIESTAE